MGEQRPMFRFRLPWMHSSAPAPPIPVATPSPPQNEVPSTTQPQTIAEPNVKPMMPAQRPFRLQQIAPAQPPPPTEPTVKSQSLSESITITSTPTNPPQAPPLWSPKISAAPETKSQSQNSYQPTSPAKTRSQINSQLPSPSLSSPQYSAASQLPSPSFTTPQFSAASQLPSPRSSADSRPPSPWQKASQEQDTSQLPSPKSAPRPSSPISSPQSSSPISFPQPSSTQPRDAPQTSITDQVQFEISSQAGTFHQPQSPQLDFQSSGQKSPITSSPSLTATNVQPKGSTENHFPSPSKTLTGMERPQPSASSSKPLLSVSVKPNVPISKPQSLEDQSKKEITPSVTLKSSMKATAQHTSNAEKPPESSGPLATYSTPPGIAKEMPSHKLRSDNTVMAHVEPKHKTMKHSSGSLTRKKEKPKVAFEAEHMQMMDQDMVWAKDEATTSKHGNLHGKQTKGMKPTDNKSTGSDSHKRVKLSNGDRVSFQKEIRSEISKIVDKMVTANPDNLKDEKASVVALVGKNKGESMQLGFDSVKRGEEFKIAERGWLDDKNSKDDQVTKAVINNNVQDINNSILMNSFITERNPGVHLALCYDETELIMSYELEQSLPTSLPPEQDPWV